MLIEEYKSPCHTKTRQIAGNRRLNINQIKNPSMFRILKEIPANLFCISPHIEGNYNYINLPSASEYNSPLFLPARLHDARTPGGTQQRNEAARLLLAVRCYV
jgi:hypothetical protein